MDKDKSLLHIKNYCLFKDGENWAQRIIPTLESFAIGGWTHRGKAGHLHSDVFAVLLSIQLPNSALCITHHTSLFVFSLLSYLLSLWHLNFLEAFLPTTSVTSPPFLFFSYFYGSSSVSLRGCVLLQSNHRLWSRACFPPSISVWKTLKA